LKNCEENNNWNVNLNIYYTESTEVSKTLARFRSKNNFIELLK